MIVNELMDYLSGFNDDIKLPVLVIDTEKDVYYSVKHYCCAPDVEHPMLIFEVGDSEPMDKLREECQEDE
jgi:hypothetical protein